MGKGKKQSAMEREENVGEKIKAPPQGWTRLLWLGPSFLWMLSAAGSGEVLFTPRIASLYGYSLLWALLAAVLLKWFINREVGRYTVCTGATVVTGFHQLPGPKNWAVWLILVPQLVVAVTTVAGMAGAASTAILLVLSGSATLYTVIVIVVTGLIVLWGRYKGVELIASVIGVLLAVAVMAAAITVFPSGSELVAGLVPKLPEEVQYDEVLPWLGFMLAGAAGLMWYSNWVLARGYGTAGLNSEEPIDLAERSKEELERLQGWIKEMTLSNTIAVIGALVVAIAFLILGAELLRPDGLVPKENETTQVLGQMLGDVWGRLGFWFMVAAVFITFWSTILTNQDGWGRLFANGTEILLRPLKLNNKWSGEVFLRKVYLVGLLMIAPVILYLNSPEPVGLLQLAGAIEAIHIPVVTGLTLFLNYKRLPPPLQPSRFTFAVTALAGLFFVAFAIFYILQLFGIIASGGS